MKSWLPQTKSCSNRGSVCECKSRNQILSHGTLYCKAPNPTGVLEEDSQLLLSNTRHVDKNKTWICEHGMQKLGSPWLASIMFGSGSATHSQQPGLVARHAGFLQALAFSTKSVDWRPARTLQQQIMCNMASLAPRCGRTHQLARTCTQELHHPLDATGTTATNARAGKQSNCLHTRSYYTHIR
eukprot:g81008.t1